MKAVWWSLSSLHDGSIGRGPQLVWRAAIGGSREAIRAKEKREKERKKRRGEAKAVQNQEWSSLRPAPTGTHTIIVLFDQSTPSYLSYGRALGHQVWYVAYAGYTALCCVACSGSSSLWGKISKNDI